MSNDDDSQAGNNHVHDTEGSGIENVPIMNTDWVPTSKFVGEQGVLGLPWARPIISTMMFFGTQSIWSTEMAYASPFLHSLGLSKAMSALVFLAAPLSGLLMQPLIGALADHSTSRFGRRRPIMLAGSLLCGLSMLALSWSTDISDMVGENRTLGIGIAVISLYGISFSINSVIACDRALVVDLLSSDEQETANLWICRMTTLGALLGVFVGHLDLQSLPGLRLLGNQFQDLSAVVSIGLIFLHSFVSLCIQERRLVVDENTVTTVPGRSIKQIIRLIRTYTLGLPWRIRIIGGILFLSWIAWFPFMFFGSLWLGDIYRRQHTFEGDQSSERERNERATQAAAQAMMYCALVSLLTSIFLPFLVAPRQSAKPKLQSNSDLSREVSRGDSRLNFKKLDLVMMWALSQAVLAACLFTTIWVNTYESAIILYTVSGFSSALLHWAPYALLGEAILDEQVFHPVNGFLHPDDIPGTSPLLSSPLSADDHDRASTLHSGYAFPALHSSSHYGMKDSDAIRNNPGIVLGVVNVAVVLPQFVVIAFSAMIFAIFEPNRSILPTPGYESLPLEARHFDSIIIIFGVGGLSTLGATYLTCRLRKETR